MTYSYFDEKHKKPLSYVEQDLHQSKLSRKKTNLKEKTNEPQ